MQGSSTSAAKAVALNFGAQPETAQLYAAGSCNQAYRASMYDRTIIIRLNADRDHAEHVKEAWCMSEAGKRGVSVAEPLGDGIWHGWNYSVQSYEGDVNGAEYDDQLAVWRFLGRSASSIHAVPVTGFGDVLVDKDKARFDGLWTNYVTDNIQALSKGEGPKGLSHAQILDLRRRFEMLGSAQLNFGLCHGDLLPRNVVLEGTRMTLIDWGAAHAHVVPHFEFRELLRSHRADSKEAKAFLTGYDGDFDRETLMAEVENLLLLCAFDLTRWARDRAPDRIKEKDEGFVRLAWDFLSG